MIAVVKTKDYEELSSLATDIIAAVVRKNPNAVLGLATGSTALGLYDGLAHRYARGELSFKNIKTVNLDEYVGLGQGDINSYVTYMRRNLFDRIDINTENTFLPDGKRADIDGAVRDYRALLSSMPRDIQVLGLGENGHIGFNEPNTPFDSLTHVVELAPSTIAANSRLFESEDLVPRRAITMGIREIVDAKRIILLASGAKKANAVRDALLGEVSPSCPASVLRTHSDIVFIVDEAAAFALPGDYRFTEKYVLL